MGGAGEMRERERERERESEQKSVREKRGKVSRVVKKSIPITVLK